MRRGRRSRRSSSSSSARRRKAWSFGEIFVEVLQGPLSPTQGYQDYFWVVEPASYTDSSGESRSSTVPLPDCTVVRSRLQAVSAVFLPGSGTNFGGSLAMTFSVGFIKMRGVPGGSSFPAASLPNAADIPSPVFDVQEDWVLLQSQAKLLTPADAQVEFFGNTLSSTVGESRSKRTLEEDYGLLGVIHAQGDTLGGPDWLFGFHAIGRALCLLP